MSGCFAQNSYRIRCCFYLSISSNSHVQVLLCRDGSWCRQLDIPSMGQNDPSDKIPEDICMHENQRFHWKAYLYKKNKTFNMYVKKSSSVS